jgi:hypothetical protein
MMGSCHPLPKAAKLRLGLLKYDVLEKIKRHYHPGRGRGVSRPQLLVVFTVVSVSPYTTSFPISSHLNNPSHHAGRAARPAERWSGTETKERKVREQS